jgi:hypothetical protein
LEMHNTPQNASDLMQRQAHSSRPHQTEVIPFICATSIYYYSYKRTDTKNII